jgi:F-type H+-transporting ATPase subunit alpha
LIKLHYVHLGTNGYLDSVPVHDVKRFEKEILEFIEVKHDNIFESIRNDKDINEEIINEIKKAVEEFLAVFKKTS